MTTVITDWLMVAITFLYLLATIIISVSNQRSAKISQKQLEANLKQYDETKRLQVMPFLQTRIMNLAEDDDYTFLNCFTFRGKESTKDYYLQGTITNVGKGPALNLSYKWTFNGESSEFYVDQDNNVLFAQDTLDSTFEVAGSFKTENDKPASATVEWCYADILGNHYCQQLILTVSDRGFFSCKNQRPILTEK